MSEIELKPCPLCGCDRIMFADMGDVFCTVCTNCDAEADGETKEEAIAIWNKIGAFPNN